MNVPLKLNEHFYFYKCNLLNKEGKLMAMY